MATIQITLDDKEKKKVDALFKQLGMSTSGAIKIFLSQALQNQGLPFTPQLKRQYHEVKAIRPKIADDGSLIFPDDAPQEIKDWIDNG